MKWGQSIYIDYLYNIVTTTHLALTVFIIVDTVVKVGEVVNAFIIIIIIITTTTTTTIIITRVGDGRGAYSV